MLNLECSFKNSNILTVCKGEMAGKELTIKFIYSIISIIVKCSLTTTVKDCSRSCSVFVPPHRSPCIRQPQTQLILALCVGDSGSLKDMIFWNGEQISESFKQDKIQMFLDLYGCCPPRNIPSTVSSAITRFKVCFNVTVILRNNLNIAHLLMHDFFKH